METILTCPSCGTAGLPGDSLVCPKCGTALSAHLVCRNCGTNIPPEAQVCSRCGEPFTVAARVLERDPGRRMPPWLSRVREQAAGLKQDSELAAESRMETFREIDRVRQAREFQEEAATAKRERKALLLLGGTIVFIVVVAIAYLILTLL
jgi:predicted nucleic acid-binding Zn ribbon protein